MRKPTVKWRHLPGRATVAHALTNKALRGTCAADRRAICHRRPAGPDIQWLGGDSVVDLIKIAEMRRCSACEKALGLTTKAA